MSELNPVLSAIPVWAIRKNGHLCLIDAEKNSTGLDIIPLFSTPELARAYSDHYPSLREAELYQTTIANLVAFFDGRVDYYILNRQA